MNYQKSQLGNSNLEKNLSMEGKNKIDFKPREKSLRSNELFICKLELQMESENS